MVLMHGNRDQDGAILSKAMGSRTEILIGLSSTYLATQVKKYSSIKILE